MLLGQNIDENLMKIIKIHRTNLIKKMKATKSFEASYHYDFLIY